MTTIYSWNVNGLRSALQKGFMNWMDATQPDILCLQESRVLPEELTPAVLQPEGYHSHWNPAKKKGYSGTAVYSKEAPQRVVNFDIPEFDDEGRLQVIHFEDFVVLNGYWPNSQAQRARLPYKLKFCQAVTTLSNALVKSGRNVVLCGDFNIAHEPIDLARPKENENTAGYYKEEREAMTAFLKEGYVDTFRDAHPSQQQFSWWSFRSQARARNVGWRIDYHCVNKAFLPRVNRAWIASDVLGSDHCPVAIEID